MTTSSTPGPEPATRPGAEPDAAREASGTRQPQNDPDPWHMGPLNDPPALSAVESELQAWDDHWEFTRWETTAGSLHVPVLTDAAFERLCGYPPGGLESTAAAEAEHEPEAEAGP
jgi:hypothetical protein